MKLKTLAIAAGIIAVLLIGGLFAYKNQSSGNAICWPYCPGMTDRDRDEIKKSAAETLSTYQSKAHNLEFKYPSVYTQKEMAGVAVFRDYNINTDCKECEDPGKTFRVYVIAGADHKQAYRNTFSTGYEALDAAVVFTKSPIKIGVSKEVFTFQDPGEVYPQTGYVVVNKDKNQSIIFITSSTGYHSAQVLADLTQVVSSLKLD